VVPTFYDRGVDGLPRQWISLMKHSMKSVSPFFNTNRMVHQYFEDVYLPAFGQWSDLFKDDLKATHDLAKWKQFIRAHWQEVDIESVYAEHLKELRVGMDLEVTARINLGQINPDDVRVALFHGGMDASGDIAEGERIWMKPGEKKKKGRFTYTGKIPCSDSGQHGYAVCIYPHTHKLSRRFEKAYIGWWNG
jgi:glycogen phosphorylase